jgi:hypothetical protein
MARKASSLVGALLSILDVSFLNSLAACLHREPQHLLDLPTKIYPYAISRTTIRFKNGTKNVPKAQPFGTKDPEIIAIGTSQLRRFTPNTRASFSRAPQGPAQYLHSLPLILRPLRPVAISTRHP